MAPFSPIRGHSAEAEYESGRSAAQRSANWFYSACRPRLPTEISGPIVWAVLAADRPRLRATGSLFAHNY